MSGGPLEYDVAALGDVPEGGTLAVELPTGERVCLVRYHGAVSAFVDECPHQGMPLSDGTVLPDGVLECAWHGARFDCLTGALKQGPATEPASSVPVRVEHDRVLVTSNR